MRLRLAAALLGASLFGSAGAASADDETDRIPQVAPAPASPSVDANQKIYLQNDVIGTVRRNDLIVAFPPPPPARWEERLFADARVEDRKSVV